jgi:hypothetical protein
MKFQLMTNLLKYRIEEGLSQNIDFHEFRKILLLFKEEGGNQEDALIVLEDLRQKSENQKVEDNILEIMDLVTGWCNVDLRVW